MNCQCSVLVTGGAGFLGQHVVSLLQTKADHVTEVRVLDLVPFENKLDYVHTKPVRSYVGSITDEKLLREACQGVQSVIHIAGVPDARMFPDKTRINEVNVKGTLVTLLAALGTESVKRFIYCSSMAVAIGNNDVSQGITESDPIPSTRLFEPYASSKLSGERIVLSANSELFRTASVRPLVMWGELDTGYVQLSQTMASQTFGYLPTVNCGDVVQHNAYVGNTAWGFVCVEHKLHEEFTRSRTLPKTLIQKNDKHKTELCSELRRRSKRMTGDAEDEKHDCDSLNTSSCDSEQLAANVYYIADDASPDNIFKFQEPFLNATGYKLSPFQCPLFIITIVFHILYAVLWLLRLFGLNVNFPVVSSICKYYQKSYTFSDAKARQELGYKPLYTTEQALERSLNYYKKFSYGKI